MFFVLLLLFFYWIDQIDDYMIMLLLFYDIYTDVTISEYPYIVLN